MVPIVPLVPMETLLLTPLTPMESICEYWTTLYYAELCLTINAGYNPSLEFVAVNSHLAGLLEQGEYQLPTKDRHPQREF